MFAKPVIRFLATICFFCFSSCINKNARQPPAVTADSSRNVIGNIASIDIPIPGPGVIAVYDKNNLPQVIKDYYSVKWEVFNIANPNEDWDAGCSGGMGIVDSVDKNGNKYPKVVHFRPDKQLVSITIDTASRTYFVTYNFGGIASGRTTDHFKLSKDGSLEIATNPK
jgi:hypothetical protein